MSDHQEESFSESDLDSPEYRDRLMRKLNCLIALLEVALARVRRSMAGPEADLDRLSRIRTNLQSTLDVCTRARVALERREATPSDLAESLACVSGFDLPEGEPFVFQELPDGARVEMTSLEEERKFELMGVIDPEEVEACNIDELACRLGSGE
ncbi:MAG: hypothetical protein QF903_03565 [Planctomycetota bacterium]|jgi:hypothetical protein|nr:hypothetical protein [Planctomycetota bacterium]MDP6762739.1 hypothetical protein [Planctomycetota bacterium]MDP6988535.1 hypothetical protein [Planctomycetota bacterium]